MTHVDQPAPRMEAQPHVTTVGHLLTQVGAGTEIRRFLTGHVTTDMPISTATLNLLVEAFREREQKKISSPADDALLIIAAVRNDHMQRQMPH